ncbi:MAG: hypothetical protein ACC652_00900 [Acidimicrobiales bacterium]
MTSSRKASPLGEATVATAESIEHLRTAATELIAAARSFLDVAEITIENPEVVPQVIQLLSRLADVSPISEDPVDDDAAYDDADRPDPNSNVVNMKGA